MVDIEQKTRKTISPLLDLYFPLTLALKHLLPENPLDTSHSLERLAEYADMKLVAESLEQTTVFAA